MEDKSIEAKRSKLKKLEEYLRTRSRLPVADIRWLLREAETKLYPAGVDGDPDEELILTRKELGMIFELLLQVASKQSRGGRLIQNQ